MSEMTIAIEWENAPSRASFEIGNGAIHGGRIARGQGTLSGATFVSTGSGDCRIELSIDAAQPGAGADPSRITIRTSLHAFTALLRDVRSEFPVFIPAYGVALAPAADPRTYAQLRQAIADRGLLSNLDRINRDAEETFENAAVSTRELTCPIWMGISRDVRIFEMGLRGPMLVTDYILPRFHGNGYCGIDMEKDYLPRKFGFVAGRGWGCTEKTWRQLDDRVLPILLFRRDDEEVRYDLTAFVTLEQSPLTRENVRGTHFLVADGLSVCHAFTEQQEKEYQSLRDVELKSNEETVLCCRIVATNTATAPRYAFFKAVHPIHGMYGVPNEHRFDGATGFAMPKDSEQVLAVCRINGQAMTQMECAVRVDPGATCVYEFFIPHRPISSQRAESLSRRNMQQCLEECRSFWRDKLDSAARVRIPEARIDEMLRAGLLQLDLICYGREPEGPLAVGDGIYGPVSAEVWKNINFFESLGLHEPARRGLQYFLEKQHDNGFMQNFTGYMLDTGCVLYALGEHYRYTRDDAWASRIGEKVKKSCRFILNWRARNKRPELRGKGYGLMEGKVADPEDQERTFMLNAYAWAGLLGAAELLQRADADFAAMLRTEAAEFRDDIRAAFFESLAAGPVIPLADGTWCPTAASWVGHDGPVCLFTDDKSWWSHGSMTIRDDVLGPIHLIARDVLDANEQASTFLLNFSNELMFSRNVASSQPYYSQHPLVHLRRGEPRAFLKAYYNAVAALADRQTYSWWEHLWHMSPHKTAETAEFLMQTRWMLWLEEGDTLHLLRGIPRKWLQTGQAIELDNVASYFGKLSLTVRSQAGHGLIEAEIRCDSERKPKRITLRLPNPYGFRAIDVQGGAYDAAGEQVLIDDFTGNARVRLTYAI